MKSKILKTYIRGNKVILIRQDLYNQKTLIIQYNVHVLNCTMLYALKKKKVF